MKGPSFQQWSASLHGNENIADCYLAVIWGIVIWLGKRINKQLSSKDGVDVEGAWDCGDKRLYERLFEWVSSAVSRDKQTHRQCHTTGATAWRAAQDTGHRDQPGIDLQSLSFFVKQDLRTRARALFKSLPIHIHIYWSMHTFIQL